MLTKEKKKEIIETYRMSPTDTGSAALQIAILTKRIARLDEHFKISPKDCTSKRGFLKLVGQRRRLLNYLRENNNAEYQKVTKKLELA